MYRGCIEVSALPHITASHSPLFIKLQLFVIVKALYHTCRGYGKHGAVKHEIFFEFF